MGGRRQGGGQVTAVEIVGRNLCRVGLSLASRMSLVYSTCWRAKVTSPLSREPLQMSSNSTCQFYEHVLRCPTDTFHRNL